MAIGDSEQLIFADRVLKHKKFQQYLRLNRYCDKKRGLCLHNLQHLLDVARTAYAMSLESGLGLSKDIIYTTALLHDIAKWRQDRYKQDHAFEGARLAEKILEDIGMDPEFVPEIQDAIRRHRKKDENGSPLAKVLYAADKSCRMCVLCDKVGGCKRYRDGRKPIFRY